MAAIAARDLRRAFLALDEIARHAVDPRAFAHAGVRALQDLVPSDLTLLSRCDLATGRRRVEGLPRGVIDHRLLDTFERRMGEHPLIDAYRRDPRPTTWRLADAIGQRAFLGSALYEEYYRPLGVRHVVAVPLHADRRHVVAFVLHRDGPPFGLAERALLERIRPQLAALHRLARIADAARAMPVPDPAPRDPAVPGRRPVADLTRREHEVVTWLGAGKTNRDIATILGTSPRTIEKHLEHVFAKLGVETRTAAVMRSGEVARRTQPPEQVDGAARMR